MEQVIFTGIIFTTCFVLCAAGLFLSGKPLRKSCGRTPEDIARDGIEVDCLCEATGKDDACSSIQESDLVEAIQRVRDSSK